MIEPTPLQRVTLRCIETTYRQHYQEHLVITNVFEPTQCARVIRPGGGILVTVCGDTIQGKLTRLRRWLEQEDRDQAHWDAGGPEWLRVY